MIDQKPLVRREVIAQFKNNLEFLDTETTGLRNSDEIVDIAIVDFSGKTLLDTLVKPTISIPTEASTIHGISNDMVSSAPTWKDVWPLIMDVTSGKTVGIYNEAYDLQLIKQSCRINNIQSSSSFQSSFCIMQLFARYYGAWDDIHQSYNWQSLEKAGRFFSSSLPNTHRALADTLLAREVFLKMAETE